MHRQQCRGAPTPEFGAKTYYLARFPSKMKEIGPIGGRANLDSPPQDQPIVNFSFGLSHYLYSNNHSWYVTIAVNILLLCIYIQVTSSFAN